LAEAVDREKEKGMKGIWAKERESMEDGEAGERES
jgi:hypothetical protein